MVYRVNIRGKDISPSEDTPGLYRTWYNDLMYSSARGDRVSETVVPETIHSYAPEDVYKIHDELRTLNISRIFS